MPNFFYQFNFYLFALIAIGAALTFVTRRSPVPAALWLVVTMFALSAIYVMLDAHFVGAIQVLVYAGAIMVVFLFVVMLLNLGHPDEISDIRGKWGRIVAGLLGVIMLAEVGTLLRTPSPASLVRDPRIAAEELETLNAVGSIAKPLFGEYVVAFEVTSLVLLVAIIGAVVLGRRRAEGEATA
jgi:NADH-quinone oxidoreductase subunit J